MSEFENQLAEQLRAFADAELKKLDEQREKAIKEKGGLDSEEAASPLRSPRPYLPKFEVGENKVIVLPVIPKKMEDDDRMGFTAQLPGNPEKYLWTVNPRSPLYRDVVKALPGAPVLLKIIRTGEGKTDTRYDCKVLGKP